MQASAAGQPVIPAALMRRCADLSYSCIKARAVPSDGREIRTSAGF